MTHPEFKARFLPCYQKLYRIAYRYMGNACDAEDMVQNTYLKLWEKQDFLEGVENDEAYAVTTLKHLCLDKLKAPLVQTDDSGLVGESSPEPPPDQALEQKEEMKIVMRIISELPEQQRQVVLMRHFEEKSTEEIERETGLSNVNIRVLLSRARKTIKELFTQTI